MNSPLGRYTEIVSALIALGIIAAASFGHLTGGQDLQFLDNIALIAVGAIFGAKSAANGYAQATVAAHKRLDRIGAPPADDGSPIPGPEGPMGPAGPQGVHG